MLVRFDSIKKYTACVLFGGVFFYFVYHMIEGERGMLAWGRLSLELSQAQEELAVLEKERFFLERQLTLLGDQVDLDLLDHQVRTFLDYVHPLEKIIIWGKNSTEPHKNLGF